MSNFLEKIIYLTENQYQQLVQNNQVNSNYLYITNEDGVTLDDLGLTVIDVIHGGTGRSSLTAGSVLVGNGLNPITEIIPTDTNTVDTLVKRDASGNFSANIITASLNGNASTASKLTHQTLNSTTLNNTAGTFAFSGSNAPWAGTDWVGLQVGDNVDKFQITASGNTLLFRQNDSGGTNTSWSDWQIFAHATKADTGIGSSIIPIYMSSGGELIASNATVGNTTTPIYIENGTIKAGTALGASAYHPDSYFKTTQTAITDNTASTNATTTFVQAVTQNANGEITVTKAPLDTSGNWDGTATKLQTTRTLWGQNFDGSANVTGNLIDVGDQIKLISGKTELQFLTSNGGAASGKFGKIGINSTYANANLTDYVLDVDGKTRLNSATAASATNLSSQLIISNSNSNAVALELWRNTKASWQIINDGGYLYFKNNWTSAKQNTYSQTGLIMDYNTGNTAFAGKVSVGQTTRNTSYTLYVNGTAYVNGATSLNSTLTVSGATTINNTLTVSGATTINNTVNVTGEATFDDDVTIAGTATIGDIIVGSGTSQNMIVTSGNNLDMVLSPTGKLCLYQGGSSGTAKVILNGNTFYPYTDNQVSLGIDGNAWKELYAKTIITTPAGSSTKPIYISSTTKQITESDATVGSQYQPVYLSSGTITAAYPVQYLSWTFANANDNQVVFSNQLFTASTYVLSIVVTSGESNLNGPITWTSGAGTLTLSTSPVTGVVSGYMLISFGADLSSTISGTSSHSNT